MVRPERRTKGDLAAVALIVVVLVAGATVLWYRSDVRATESVTAAPAGEPAPARTVPPALAEVWRAPSPATPLPVVAGPAVVTGAGGDVLGRDPSTGKVRWRYSRDLPLCTVSSAWDHAIAVYRKAWNCSEVTALEGETGKRGPQRNTDASFGTQLVSDGTYVTTSGKIVESWRSDLVRTQQYGIPPNLKNADNNLDRPDCERTSVGVGDERVAVIEECPRETSDRVTVIKARPEDDEEPEEVFTAATGSEAANVVAVTRSNTAVVLRDQAKLVVYDSRGGVRAQFDLPGTPPDTGNGVEATTPERLWTVRVDPRNATDLSRTASTLATALGPLDPSVTEQGVLDTAARSPESFRVTALPESEFETVSDRLDGLPGVSFGSIEYWHTGTTTVALNTADLNPLWTVPDTLGPGALFGGELLVPVRDGLAVLDPATGARQRVIPVNRQGYAGPVQLDSVGNVLLERRGDTIVALS